MTPQEKALSICQSFGYLGLKSEQTVIEAHKFS